MSRSPQSPSSIATAADYADAMLTARAARTIFAFALILILLLQLALFCVVHFTSKLDSQVPPQTAVAPNPPASTQPVPQIPTGTGRNSRPILKYFVGLSGYFGLIVSILLCLMLLLLLNVMLIGRLIGVSHVTSAFIFSLLILLLVFPWQAFLNNQDLTAQEFKVPGVLYTFDELVVNGHFGNGNIIQWVRFILAPIITIILVFTVLLKSSYGLRMALGEETGGSKKRKDVLEDDLAGDRNVIR
jgi:hypothetical protein